MKRAKKGPTIAAGGSRPEVQTGPRGGKFYIAETGGKVYGTPPPAAARAPKKAPEPKWQIEAGTNRRFFFIFNDQGGRTYEDSGKKKRDTGVPAPPKQAPPPVPVPKHGAAERRLARLKEQRGIKTSVQEPEPSKVSQVVLDAYRVPKEQRLGIMKYQNNMKGGFDREAVDKVTIETIRKHGFDRVMRRIPLGVLNITDTISKEHAKGFEGEAVMGLYHGGVKIPPPASQLRTLDAHVVTSLVHNDKKYRIGESGNVSGNRPYDPTKRSERGPDRDAWIENTYGATLVHEMSHHVHHAIVQEQPFLADKIRYRHDRHVEEYKKGVSLAVSLYAYTNDKEWFAETHTAYLLHNEELRRYDPESWAFMKEIRTKMGMED